MGTAIVLLVVDAVLRFRFPAPGDTSLNLNTVADGPWEHPTADLSPTFAFRPSPSSESRQEHQSPHIAAGPWEQPLSCSSPTPASFRPIRPTRHHDTGFKHDRASAGPWELHASTCRRPPAFDQQRTPSSTTPLCRSLCSQLASSPHDHRRRPCFQLASDRTTAHPALRKPLLPTSKLATHWLIQHPQVMYHPLFICTHIPKCVLLASAVAAA